MHEPGFFLRTECKNTQGHVIKRKSGLVLVDSVDLENYKKTQRRETKKNGIKVENVRKM